MMMADKKAKTNWETPQDFFDILNKEFKFTLDVCADSKTTKCEYYINEKIDGLKQIWYLDRVWMNPPYDRNIGLWIKKAYETAQEGGLVVALIQGRSTDTKWWHDYVMGASEIRIIKNRLSFGMNRVFTRANISSVVVIFRPHCKGYPEICSIDVKGNRI